MQRLAVFDSRRASEEQLKEHVHWLTGCQLTEPAVQVHYCIYCNKTFLGTKQSKKIQRTAVILL